VGRWDGFGVELAGNGVATFPPLLQSYRAGGILSEQGTFPDVPAKHRRALMPGLLGDDAFGDANRSSCGRKTGPQRVTGHLGGVKPGSTSVALQHEGHRL
jgi:hypothetical protein